MLWVGLTLPLLGFVRQKPFGVVAHRELEGGMVRLRVCTSTRPPLGPRPARPAT